MVALANDFGTIFFDGTATAQQKTELLRRSSATQHAVLEPVAAFLSACVAWREGGQQPLPPEAERMLGRLNLFFERCAQGRKKPPATALPSAAAASKKNAPSAFVPIPEAMQRQLLELSAETSRRVEANGLLLTQIFDDMKLLQALAR
jgi:hypothetical protein